MQRLDELQEVIGYKFKNIKLLNEATTHSSYANEHRDEKVRDNERLEFLGDAILDCIVSRYLFTNYDKMNEGEMSKYRASLVCEDSLAKNAKIINLGKFIVLGKGEEKTGGRERDSILADAFEAVTGALFLDGGYDAASNFIDSTIIKDVEKIEYIEEVYDDPKTELQEVIQHKSDVPLHYVVTKEEGPAHDKNFFVDLYQGDKKLSEGVGKSKKEAEQAAAKYVLDKLNK